ncbi:MAG: TolC family protein [Sphingobacteriales bacterium]|nr:MAG: TolC family protein [Sphingobacteriales bacterium]
MSIVKQRQLLGLVVLGALCITGCMMPSKLSEPPDLRVPEGFAAMDGKEGRVISRQLLFTDPALVTLLDTAVRQNPDAYIALHRIEAARSQLRIRKGALLPALEAAGSASVQRYGDYTMEGVGNFDTNLSGNIDENQKVPLPHVPSYFIGLRSSWEIDLWGKLRSQKEAAFMRLLGTEQARNLVITTLVAEVSARYYELQALDEELEILKHNLSLQDSAVRIAEVQKEAGRATQLAIQQFEAQLLRTRSLLLQTEQRILRTENELNALLGRFPQPVVRSSRLLQQPLPGEFSAGLPRAILDRRPDVLQAELELRASRADVAAARAAFLPALSLNPFAGYSAFSGSLLFDPGSLVYGIAGSAVAPLVNRSAVKGNHSRAEAERMEAFYRYRKTVLGAFSEVQSTLNDLEKLRQIDSLNRQETIVLAAAVTTSNELFRVGYASYLDVITAQRNALDAQINQVETRRNLFVSLISLYRATGGGW